jgi:WD40 repeat protein/serine/threonine protein kinase
VKYVEGKTMYEKWNQVEEIFSAALSREPSERATFLDQACVNDRLLREEVESLLDNAEARISIIDAPFFGEIGRFDLEGKTIEHYRIVSRIGSGGMGEVYLAEDNRLGRRVALKMLPPIIAQDESYIGRMQKEARAAAALNHPNIVTIYDIGQDDSTPFIAMEFIEGETLRERMGSPMPIHEVVSIGIQVASGLAAAHQAKILHRDIKPENIMIDVHGEVKILDFGIAQLKDPLASVLDSQFTLVAADGGTQASILAGTPGYFSPEQALGEPLDARTDIFSLGVLLFEMATGRRPFKGETRTEVRQHLLKMEVQPLSTFRKNVPADLQRMIARALMKNRDDRYQSVTEMLSELSEFSREAGEELDATQRANRMFRQYLSIYAVDKRALIPLAKLYFISRHSDMKRGERGRELFKKSLRWGLIKASASMLLIFLATTIAAAILSVNENWDETILKDGHTRAVRQVAFSPDGRLLVSVGEDAKVIVWDFARRMPLVISADHTKIVTSVTFSGDGKWFATGSEDKSVTIWDAVHLKKEIVLQGLPGTVVAIAFSPNSRLLAAGTNDESWQGKGRILLWKVGQWDKVRELTCQLNNYGRLIFSPDSQELISSGGQNLDLNTGESTRSEFQGGVNWIAMSPDRTRMLTMDGAGTVRMIDLLQHRTMTHDAVHQDSGRAAAFSPDGRFAATGADDIVLWDASTMTKLARFEASSVVWNVVFSPDGRWLVSTHGDSSILVWDVEDRRLAAALNGHSGAVRSVVFSPDGKLIASAAEDRSVILWNAESGRKIAVLQGPSTRLTGVAFSPDGKQVASSEFHQTINMWNIADEQAPLTVPAKGSLYSVAISPDNSSIATTNGIYDSRDGHLIVGFGAPVEAGEMYGLSFSSDGRWLAGASPGHSIVLFDTQSWELREKVNIADVTFISISFSPDNEHLVTGDDEGTVRLWSIEPLRQIALLGRHSSRIKSVAFSPDGKEVASTGDDNAIRIWDVNGGGLIRQIGTHTKPVLSVAYAPDGKRIVSGEHDFSVRLYTRHRSLWGHRLE